MNERTTGQTGYKAEKHKGAIDAILFDEREREEFMHLYEQTTLYDAKLSFTAEYLDRISQLRSTMKSDEFRDFYSGLGVTHQFLLDNFIPRTRICDPQVKAQKEKLALDMITKGFIDPDSDESSEAEGEIRRYVGSDHLLSQLSGDLPDYIVAAIGTNLKFAHLSPEQRSRLRPFFTRSLLRPYLGDIEVHRPKGKIPIDTMVKEIPEEFFKNADGNSLQMVKTFFSLRLLRYFNKDVRLGFSEIDKIVNSRDPKIYRSELKKDFFREIRTEFSEVNQMRFPKELKTVVDWVDRFKDDNLPFPSFFQKWVAYEFLKTRRWLNNGKCGGAKTATSLVSMEMAGAKRVTIFGPAKARNTWRDEIKNIYKPGQAPSFFAVSCIDDLSDPSVETSKFLFISDEFISQTCDDASVNGNGGRRKKDFKMLEDALISRRKTDGVISDESDDFRNPKAKCSHVFTGLIEGMDRQYESNPETWDSFGNPQKLPMWALTATLIVNSPEDPDIIMANLYPDRFASPYGKKYDASGKELHRYSDYAVTPELAYSLLMGERLILQYSLEDLNEKLVPRKEPETVFFDLSPAEQVIYQWIARQGFNVLSKSRLLSDYLINPVFTRNNLLAKGTNPEPVSTEELRSLFKELYEAWKSWSAHRSKGIPEEKFSADWIAKFGYGNFLVSCFFNKDLEYGIDSLAFALEKHDHRLQKDWQISKTLIPLRYGGYLQASQKMQFVKQKLDEVLVNGEPEKKVMILVPQRREGITRDSSKKRTRVEELENEAWSVYEQIHLLGMFPPEMLFAVDGTVPFKKRTQEAIVYTTDGYKDIVGAATPDSMGESMDWALKRVPAMENIRGMDAVYLSYPWSHASLEQTDGRFDRASLGENFFLRLFRTEVRNSVDEGKSRIIRAKYLLGEATMHNVPLTPEDKKLFKPKDSAGMMLTDHNIAPNIVTKYTFAKLRGEGAERFAEEMNRQHNGKMLADIVAESYFKEGQDQHTIVGNNARMVSRLILEDNPRSVLSLAAGTCLVNRNLHNNGYRGTVDNYDINPAMMRVAKAKFNYLGRTIVGNAADLIRDPQPGESGRPKMADGSYDAIDCSMMLDLTKLYDKKTYEKKHPETSERVQVLMEINRVLKTGGKAIITLPEGTFKNNEDAFPAFVDELTRHFGFRVAGPVGLAYGTDMRPKRKISWVIKVEKTGKPDFTGFDITKLAFPSEADTFISHYRGGKGKSFEPLTGDHPMFDFNQFEVIDPLTGQTTELDNKHIVFKQPEPAAVSSVLDDFENRKAAEVIYITPDDAENGNGNGNGDEGTEEEPVPEPSDIKVAHTAEKPAAEISHQNPSADSSPIPAPSHLKDLGLDEAGIMLTFDRRYNLSKNSWQSDLWSELRRILENNLHLTYEEAEDKLIQIIYDNGIELPSTWPDRDKENFRRRLLKLVRQNGNTHQVVFNRKGGE